MTSSYDFHNTGTYLLRALRHVLLVSLLYFRPSLKLFPLRLNQSADKGKIYSSFHIVEQK